MRISPGLPSVEGCSLSSRRPRSNRLHDLDGQGTLLVRRELAGQRQARLAFLGHDRLADQRRQAPRERLEHGIDVGGGQPRAELIDQRVVGGEVQRLAEQARLVAHQVHDLFQVGREAGELALGARGQPL